MITGAAQGIGYALAHQFGTAGYRIFGIDVDQERAKIAETTLKHLGIHVTFQIVDLTYEQDVQQLLTWLNQGPPIQVLIHNAGINHVSPFRDSNIREQLRILQINLQVPMTLTEELMDQSTLATDGTLVFISSLSHFVGYPGAAVYAASKDGLAGYASSLADSGWNVLTVFPGPTRTEHARRHSPDNRREHRRMPPERLAALIFKAVQKRKRILIPGAANQLFAWLGETFPSLTEWMLCRTILQKLKKPSQAD